MSDLKPCGCGEPPMRGPLVRRDTLGVQCARLWEAGTCGEWAQAKTQAEADAAWNSPYRTGNRRATPQGGDK